VACGWQFSNKWNQEVKVPIKKCLAIEKTILSLKKDFSEWFVKFIIVDERYTGRVSEKVSSVGLKLTVY